MWMVLLAVALGVAPGAWADRVTLTSGRVIEGTILEETDSTLVIESRVGKSKIRLEFDLYDVELIERTPPADKAARGDDTATRERLRESLGRPEAAPGEGAEDDAEGDEPGPAERGPRYVVIELRGPIGLFGEDLDASAITAAGLDRALRWAVKRGVEEVALVVSSGGGLIDEAGRIADTLESHRGSLRYVCLVERAISAAMVIPLSCERVVMARGSSMGGAVSYTIADTGEAEVDAKMNSIWSARLEGLAERRGYLTEAVRAMAVAEAEFYAWEDGGRLRWATSAPDGVSRFVVQDSDLMVLTLTGEQAVGIGLAERPDGETLWVEGEASRPGWVDVGVGGTRLVRKEAERLIRVETERRDDVSGVIDDIEDAYRLMSTLEAGVEAAEALDPSRFEYYHRDGLLTGESQRKWRSRTDDALRAWDDVSDRIDRIRRIGRNAERTIGRLEAAEPHWSFGARHGVELEALRGALDSLHEEGHRLGQVRDAVRRTMDRLRRERNRTRV
jgi:hypothetical protein